MEIDNRFIKIAESKVMCIAMKSIAGKQGEQADD